MHYILVDAKLHTYLWPICYRFPQASINDLITTVILNLQGFNVRHPSYPSIETQSVPEAQHVPAYNGALSYEYNQLFVSHLFQASLLKVAFVLGAVLG